VSTKNNEKQTSFEKPDERKHDPYLAGSYRSIFMNGSLRFKSANCGKNIL
jgi:hypothetical protein